MLASNDNSYMKEYVRRQRVRATRDVNGRPGGVAGEKLLTDRGEYIRFLESQLDAVTQACLTAQSFDERILSLGAASVAHDEKILNLARLIKCSQGVAEEQEAAYRAALDRVHRRVAECERAARETAETENRKIRRARSSRKRDSSAAPSPPARTAPHATLPPPPWTWASSTRSSARGPRRTSARRMRNCFAAENRLARARRRRRRGCPRRGSKRRKTADGGGAQARGGCRANGVG